ncbi:MAG: hypothetical protein FWH27_18030 [Planctomycetaceae bacterium]|nr:hypothetical protein [Planctomycetaceae bacterium]
MPKAIVLFSGGLDSLVTTLMLRRLGIEVVALNIVTPLHDVSQAAMARAEAFGLTLRVRRVDESYAGLIAHPKWGYGSAVNPCIDCRVAMLKIARQVMREEQADFIATGEVIGQRPNSQKMHQLALIAKEAGVTDCLVRPLSARAMNPSRVERDGLLDREQLHALTGRGRTKLMQLAEELGVRDIPQPASGCLLCEKTFAPRVRDVLRHNLNPANWHFEVLPFGRVVRIDANTQCVVARNIDDCRNLVRLFEQDDRPGAALLEPDSFTGPAALLIGDSYNAEHESVAGGQVLRFSNPNRYDPANAFVRFRDATRDERRQVFPDPDASEYKHF